MSLTAQGYFNALRSYLNTAEYEVKDTDAAGRIVLKEKVFVGASPSRLNIGSDWVSPAKHL
jgi:hypothetical protein